MVIGNASLSTGVTSIGSALPGVSYDYRAYQPYINPLVPGHGEVRSVTEHTSWIQDWDRQVASGAYVPSLTETVGMSMLGTLLPPSDPAYTVTYADGSTVYKMSPGPTTGGYIGQATALAGGAGAAAKGGLSLLSHVVQEAFENTVSTLTGLPFFAPGKTKAGAQSVKIAAPSSGASNINAGAALNAKLRGLQSAQENAARVRQLPDGRIRYYDAERPAGTPGLTRGNAYVTEWNPITGQVRSWAESYDHAGNVTRVHPKMIDGQQVNGPHFPPTGSEVGR
jgi:hypothetical protein